MTMYRLLRMNGDIEKDLGTSHCFTASITSLGVFGLVCVLPGIASFEEVISAVVIVDLPTG